MKLLRKFSIVTVTLLIGSLIFVSCDDNDSNPTFSSSLDGVMINGVCWATRNIDAPGEFATSPEALGKFYKWNDTIGWSSLDFTANIIGEDTLSHSGVPYALSTKLDTAWVDIKPLGSPLIDVWDKLAPPVSTDTVSGDTVQWASATGICPAGWRLPTQAEQQSLINSGYKWTTVNGVSGCVFGSGDNAIFIPAAGYRYHYGGSLMRAGQYGCYWTQNGKSKSKTASYLFFQDGGLILANPAMSVSDALSVRCVKIQ